MRNNRNGKVILCYLCGSMVSGTFCAGYSPHSKAEQPCGYCTLLLMSYACRNCSTRQRLHMGSDIPSTFPLTQPWLLHQHLQGDVTGSAIAVSHQGNPQDRFNFASTVEVAQGRVALWFFVLFSFLKPFKLKHLTNSWRRLLIPPIALSFEASERSHYNFTILQQKQE